MTLTGHALVRRSLSLIIAAWVSVSIMSPVAQAQAERDVISEEKDAYVQGFHQSDDVTPLVTSCEENSNSALTNYQSGGDFETDRDIVNSLSPLVVDLFPQAEGQLDYFSVTTPDENNQRIIFAGFERQSISGHGTVFVDENLSVVSSHYGTVEDTESGHVRVTAYINGEVDKTVTLDKEKSGTGSDEFLEMIAGSEELSVPNPSDQGFQEGSKFTLAQASGYRGWDGFIECIKNDGSVPGFIAGAIGSGCGFLGRYHPVAGAGCAVGVSGVYAAVVYYCALSAMNIQRWQILR